MSKVARRTINEKAFYTYESFVLSRIHLYRALYFHKTSRCMDTMVKFILETTNSEVKWSNYAENLKETEEYLEDADYEFEENYLKLDDHYFTTKIRDLIKEGNLNQNVENMIQLFLKRKTLKCVAEGTFKEASDIINTRNMLNAKKKDIAKEADKIYKKSKKLNDKGQIITANDIFLDISIISTLKMPRKGAFSTGEIFIRKQDEYLEPSGRDSDILSALCGKLDTLFCYIYRGKDEEYKKAITKAIEKGFSGLQLTSY